MSQPGSSKETGYYVCKAPKALPDEIGDLPADPALRAMMTDQKSEIARAQKAGTMPRTRNALPFENLPGRQGRKKNRLPACE